MRRASSDPDLTCFPLRSSHWVRAHLSAWQEQGLVAALFPAEHFALGAARVVPSALRMASACRHYFFCRLRQRLSILLHSNFSTTALPFSTPYASILSTSSYLECFIILLSFCNDIHCPWSFWPFSLSTPSSQRLFPGCIFPEHLTPLATRGSASIRILLQRRPLGRTTSLLSRPRLRLRRSQLWRLCLRVLTPLQRTLRPQINPRPKRCGSKSAKSAQSIPTPSRPSSSSC